MTEKEKDLLAKDLCARLLYGVKVQCGDYLFTFDKDHMGIGMLYKDFNGNPLESPKIILSGCYYGEDIKPYLFPLSSMTEEQAKELFILYGIKDILSIKEITDEYIDFEVDDGFCSIETKTIWYDELISSIETFDWLNKNHFDYRGLIPLGLALDATNLNIY